MDIGEVWAYRKGSKGTFTPVKIITLGSTPKRPRTKVKFLDDAYEGIQEWFPTGRLWCRWDDVDEYAASERRWNMLHSLGRCTFDEEFAAISVLEEVAPNIASLDVVGALLIHDLPKLSEAIGWDESQIIASTGHLFEDGDHCVSWPTAELILQRLARKNPMQVRAIVRTLNNQYMNRKQQYAEKLHDELWFRADEDIHREADRVYGVSGDPSANVILRWLGEREAFEMQQVEALRIHHTKLRVLARRAVPYLRALKRGTTTTLANEIEALLGEEIEPKL